MALSVIAVSISVSPFCHRRGRDVHVHDVGAEPLARQLERALRARRGLEEQVDQRAAAQQIALLARLGGCRRRPCRRGRADKLISDAPSPSQSRRWRCAKWSAATLATALVIKGVAIGRSLRPRASRDSAAKFARTAAASSLKALIALSAPRQAINRGTMAATFATHEVFNQPPPFEDVQPLQRPTGAHRRGGPRGGGAARRRLGAFGQLRQRRGPGAGAARQRAPAEAQRPTTARAGGCDMVEFHPGLPRADAHSCDREGLHCSAWEHLARRASAATRRQRGARRPPSTWRPRWKPGTVPDHHDQRRGAGAAAAAASSPREWLPRILPRNYDPSFAAAGAKTRRHARHGHDGEAGRHRRARQRRRPSRPGTAGRAASTASPATNGSCRRRCRTRSWCWRRRRAGCPAS